MICPASPCPATYPASFPAGIAGTPVPAGTYYVPTRFDPMPRSPTHGLTSRKPTAPISALQVELNHRFSRGLSLRGVYTWSKTIDDGDSLNATTSGGEPALASNPFDLRADRGLANFDVRNVGVIGRGYALPLGRRTLAGERMVAINSIVTLQGGFPFTPQFSYNPSNNGDTRNPVRPVREPRIHRSGDSGQSESVVQSRGVSRASEQQRLLRQSRPRHADRARAWPPGIFRFSKTRQFARGRHLQFRAEFFNILNRANFNTPNAVVFTPTGVSPTAGVITRTSTTSRQIQFGVKILF